MKDVVIVAACRTAIGKFGGTLAGTAAAALGGAVIVRLLERAGIAAAEVDDIIMGQVLTAGVGQNPARQAAMKAGIPADSPAITINQVCGSGLRAAHLAAQSIAAGDADIVVAGGQENMSASPHVLNNSRNGIRLGSGALTDTMVYDGLTDVFNQYHMGITAENVAKKYDVGREEQDAFACASQNKAEAAQKAGKFDDEIIPVEIPRRKAEPLVFNRDEYIREGATAESLAALRPAFDKNGTVTAGNASGINDGAAAVLLMSAAAAAKRNITPLAAVCCRGELRRGPGDDGNWPCAGLAQVLAKGGLERRRLGLDGNQRGLCRAGDCGQPRNAMGRFQSECQRRRHRPRPSHRRVRRPRPHHPPPRNAPPQRQKSPRLPMHRRRHGDCIGGGEVSGCFNRLRCVYSSYSKE